MKYSGITMNERLYDSGLLDKFELALKRKDKSKIIEILRAVEVDEDTIKAYVNDCDRNQIKKIMLYLKRLLGCWIE